MWVYLFDFTAILHHAWKLFRCCGTEGDVKLRLSKCFKILKMNTNTPCHVRGAQKRRPIALMWLLCTTYQLSQWYFSYLSRASEGLIASDLWSASEIKTFSPAFSCCFGRVSWIDRKSLPYDCSVFTWRYLWLLWTLGLCSNNSPWPLASSM